TLTGDGNALCNGQAVAAAANTQAIPTAIREINVARTIQSLCAIEVNATEESLVYRSTCQRKVVCNRQIEEALIKVQRARQGHAAQKGCPGELAADGGACFDCCIANAASGQGKRSVAA